MEKLKPYKGAVVAAAGLAVFLGLYFLLIGGIRKTTATAVKNIDAKTNELAAAIKNRNTAPNGADKTADVEAALPQNGDIENAAAALANAEAARAAILAAMNSKQFGIILREKDPLIGTTYPVINPSDFSPAYNDAFTSIVTTYAERGMKLTPRWQREYDTAVRVWAGGTAGIQWEKRPDNMFTRFQASVIPAPKDPEKDGNLFRDLYYIQQQLYIQNDLVQALVRVRENPAHPEWKDAIAKITYVKFPTQPAVTDDLSLQVLKYDFVIEMSLSAEIALPVIREFLYPSKVVQNPGASWVPEAGVSVGCPVDVYSFWIRRGNELMPATYEYADVIDILGPGKSEDNSTLTDEEIDLLESTYGPAKYEQTPPVDVQLVCRYLLPIPAERPLWIPLTDWTQLMDKTGKGSIRGGD